jgi:hypothetical protein
MFGAAREGLPAAASGDKTVGLASLPVRRSPDCLLRQARGSDGRCCWLEHLRSQHVREGSRKDLYSLAPGLGLLIGRACRTYSRRCRSGSGCQLACQLFGPDLIVLSLCARRPPRLLLPGWSAAPVCTRPPHEGEPDAGPGPPAGRNPRPGRSETRGRCDAVKRPGGGMINESQTAGKRAEARRCRLRAVANGGDGCGQCA